MNKAITVDGLTKTYRIGSSLFGASVTYDAIKDVSFDVPVGQRLGIIGKNGAGKSTLLKILSRITSPTSGSIKIVGSISSLLEVGTGFHPEMTGRENIFLNGAILGMPSSEINKKFDDIVNFSGVEQFIDTPIKRYSSGMQTRLAFAVSAVLEPDILVVDEVLAVGDIEFQDQCMRRMKTISESGRTILFVSHNMAAIRRLCDRCILLEKGQITKDSIVVEDVVQSYLKGNSELKSAWKQDGATSYQNEAIQPISLYIANSDKESIFPEDDIELCFEFDLTHIPHNLSIGFHLYTSNMEELFYSYTTDHNNFRNSELRTGRNLLKVQIPSSLLNAQVYTIKMAAGLLGDRSIFSAEESEIKLRFRLQEYKMRSSRWHNKGNAFAPLLDWRVNEND